MAEPRPPATLEAFSFILDLTAIYMLHATNVPTT